MTTETLPRSRTCGFRFSPTDALVLLLGTGATVALWPMMGALSLIVPAALGHFFLFCNVFRIHRKLELIWAVAFLGNWTLWTALDRFDWISVLAVQTPITIALIMAEMFSPRYHGIFSHRINARHLDDYLDGRQGGRDN